MNYPLDKEKKSNIILTILSVDMRNIVEHLRQVRRRVERCLPIKADSLEGFIKEVREKDTNSVQVKPAYRYKTRLIGNPLKPFSVLGEEGLIKYSSRTHSGREITCNEILYWVEITDDSSRRIKALRCVTTAIHRSMTLQERLPDININLRGYDLEHANKEMLLQKALIQNILPYPHTL